MTDLQHCTGLDIAAQTSLTSDDNPPPPSLVHVRGVEPITWSTGTD